MALVPDPGGGRCHDGDLDLARRCGRGDEDAQRSFVDRFGSLVYSICGRRGITGPDRDDVAQQIMLDAFRALPRYQGASRLATWIYSLSLRRVADHFRSSQRRDVRPVGRGTIRFRLRRRRRAHRLQTSKSSRPRRASA